jgi:hypothetical protein
VAILQVVCKVSEAERDALAFLCGPPGCWPSQGFVLRYALKFFCSHISYFPKELLERMDKEKLARKRTSRSQVLVEESDLARGLEENGITSKIGEEIPSASPAVETPSVADRLGEEFCKMHGKPKPGRVRPKKPAKKAPAKKARSKPK